MGVTPELLGAPVTDARAGLIREGLELAYGVEPGAETIAQSLLAVSSERSYHPVRRYLLGLAWDGVTRLDGLADALGARRQVERQMLRRWAISAVARALTPGCKVDTVLVLVGTQGARKSSFFAALAGDWFTDSHVDLSSKDVYLQIARSWILEWGEVERVTAKRGADEVKSFLSSRVDVYRPPYGRAIVHVPRSCVIVGSTNEDAFLSDPTGSRRFWVVRCERADIDVAMVSRDRDQLWAEACAAFRAGEQWWLSDEEVSEQQESAERFRVTDPWESAIAEWVETAEGVITTRRILTAGLDLELSRATGREDQRVAATMRRLGWVRRVSRVNGVATRVWERGS
jgi:predicted P-loop ATPase